MSKQSRLAFAIVLLMFPLLFGLPSTFAANTLTKVQSGLVAQDALTSSVTSRWILYGNAVVQNAPHSYSWNNSGLYLGVQALFAGGWVGYFAKSPNTAAQLFHAILTIPYSSISSNSFDTGLYVQTSSPLIDYVACAAQATPNGHYWMVVSATGGVNSASQFNVLYRQPGGPLTQDCTIVTNGQNMLRVYLGGQLVYSSNSLNLQMPSPFNAYLEVQTTDPNGVLYGSYSDYYATTSDSMKVLNIAQGDTAKLVGSSNNVLASGTPAQNGTVMLALGNYEMPVSGSIEVVDSSNNLLMSSGPTSVWGGDIYQTSASTSRLTIDTQDTANNAIDGYYTVLSQNGQVVATGFSPASFTVNDGQAYSIEVQDYGSYHFSHWLDTASTNRYRIISVTTDTTITAVYQNSNGAGSPSGQSSITVSTLNSAGSPMNGYYVTLMQGGAKLQSCFSPCSFTVNGGQTYQLEAASYGSEKFSHWQNDGSTGLETVVVPSASTPISLTATYTP